MKISESKQILYIIIFLFNNTLFSQDCTAINPNQYGECGDELGYGWNGSECQLIYGCDLADDFQYSFITYEECNLTCIEHSSLGDLNNDSFINVIDVVSLVNLIIGGDNYVPSGDLNFDSIINVIDIVSLVNIIISTMDTRDTWQIINEDILSPKCAICHYDGSFYAETSNLILTESLAYNQLINRNPDNQSALENGLTLLSDEGGLYGLLTSFLWEKINVRNTNHFYSEHPQYGEIMPLGGPFLTNGELDFIEDWIMQGSPEFGVVADPIILNDDSEYQTPEFEALEPPTLGVQYHIGPFNVYPNSEREFLYYVPPIADEYYINRFQISMTPGSHHFIAYQFSDNYTQATPNIYEYRDIHMPYADPFDIFFNIGALNEHIFVFGTQWPSWDYSFPEGVALKVNSNYGLDLNPHYFNYTNDTIIGEVYVNVHTELPENVEHVAGILQLGNNDIYLPPNQETTLEKIFSTNEILNSTNIELPDGSTQINIFQLFSHAHQLMTRFDILILNQNGEEELIYTALDWEHPPILQLDPPLIINSNQSIIARATYNNTTNEPVTFGLFSTNEMMIIFGLIYFE